MAFITLETGGSRPPTDSEALQIRTAIGAAAATDVTPGITRYNYTDADSPITLSNALTGGIIFLNASGGDITLALPDITSDLAKFTIKRIDTAVANTVTVNPSAADTGSVDIDTAASLDFPALAAAELVSNTTAWWVTDFAVNNALTVTP